MYEGHFFDNKFEGKGRYIYNDGSVYAGDWSNGLRHGRGILTKKDGSKYDGTWHNDLQDGSGTEINGPDAEEFFANSTYKGRF